MILYKVKVHLPDTQVVRQVGGRIFTVTLTNWTFVSAAARELVGRSQKKQEEFTFFYRNCSYVDGSNWVPQQIDSFVTKQELELPLNYQVFSREYDWAPMP
ncbi:hypothetical protein LX87_02289 [Larkinella arboricola]|uniref:Uncharacterized protein n=1 Tax=Larkinella arboricola TaxID=643671 RepID=A0A327WW80_LARAB|nr:hypothetical protein [Larkinella arboricola]RAJ97389.1 hypothetical protein LX87_02289 [Larkinella arboricola]